MRRRKHQHDAATNLEAARIILAEPEVYGGEEALAVRWAHAVVDAADLPQRRAA